MEKLHEAWYGVNETKNDMYTRVTMKTEQNDKINTSSQEKQRLLSGGIRLKTADHFYYLFLKRVSRIKHSQIFWFFPTKKTGCELRITASVCKTHLLCSFPGACIENRRFVYYYNYSIVIRIAFLSKSVIYNVTSLCVSFANIWMKMCEWSKKKIKKMLHLVSWRNPSPLFIENWNVWMSQLMTWSCCSILLSSNGNVGIYCITHSHLLFFTTTDSFFCPVTFSSSILSLCLHIYTQAE